MPVTTCRLRQRCDDSSLQEGTPFVFGPEERAKAGAWIDKHWTGSKQCPISGHNDWVVAPNVVQLLDLPPAGGLVVGGSVYPSVLVICNQCGYTITFNALKMGLFSVRVG